MNLQNPEFKSLSRPGIAYIGPRDPNKYLNICVTAKSGICIHITADYITQATVPPAPAAPPSTVREGTSHQLAGVLTA